ncbi:non-functional NADPH-dependent codeinone reductase 2-like isoform X3 [Salvia hispanica]|uniref:non-functional NADPH-dependent codeinone reductase 2-like isoform X1 n=1 Tax=Salvia hispanica TaxID=49212 RepID=UPI0020093831|nr:non-functional NADPH-dependent codeinone reductase 2-like isoform X1 [Salvia hispanica]XP_047960262.1 non-functional NADPH-dependent codeinone reductase 2-like isoform X2 [Salvia hispanica]XP_047960263.1 non-functional NADPH-dependent codeinone reductase 2-like isoform X3 [Salvia hispanica]XP_047960265.1 non-functional NADPH-dependent codeinone reductase 2-like isoform X2 [Salvia hispanica]XP_047960266.1 non-functional NADPH-dependent codeinone reductase 2-like isoform X1 [Salvia hispanica]
MASISIAEITLNSGTGKIPALGFGTASDPPVDSLTTKTAVLQGIELGYRHFDTAALYNSEQPLGEAIAEAVDRRLIGSRRDLFITSKLWCTDAHPQHVVSALNTTLKNLRTDYIDLYLIHWPVSAKAGKVEYPIKAEDFAPMDFGAVWAAMEECHRIGLTRAIGVSNFSSKKLLEILATAKIPPAVNQVEVNPCWQQKKLIQFCKEKGILVVAYAPLGAFRTFYGTNRVMESQVLKQIAEAKGKTVAQVALRWAYEQGIGVVAKSFNRERMEENMGLFDWSLSSEEVDLISEIPQERACLGEDYTSIYGPYKTIQQLWDEEDIS